MTQPIWMETWNETVKQASEQPKKKLTELQKKVMEQHLRTFFREVKRLEETEKEYQHASYYGFFNQEENIIGIGIKERPTSFVYVALSLVNGEVRFQKAEPVEMTFPGADIQDSEGNVVSFKPYVNIRQRLIQN